MVQCPITVLPVYNHDILMAGSLLRTDHITKKHSIKLIERASKDGCDQILYSRTVTRTVFSDQVIRKKIGTSSLVALAQFAKGFHQRCCCFFLTVGRHELSEKGARVYGKLGNYSRHASASGITDASLAYHSKEWSHNRQYVFHDSGQKIPSFKLSAGVVLLTLPRNAYISMMARPHGKCRLPYMIVGAARAGVMADAARATTASFL